MFKKFAFAAIAATVIAGSSSIARADVMIEDANTGLNQFYHMGTIAELAARGLPISDSARAYYKKAPRAAAGKRGNVYLLEDRGVFSSGSVDQDRKHDGHW